MFNDRVGAPHGSVALPSFRDKGSFEKGKSDRQAFIRAVQNFREHHILRITACG
jgi:hypothetical protein